MSIVLDPSNYYFRYASELKDCAKGGYIDGRIHLPPRKGLKVVISTYHIEDGQHDLTQDSRVHPNLLKTLIFRREKRCSELEPALSEKDWKVELLVEDKKVFRVHEYFSADEEGKVNRKDELFKLEDESLLPLSKLHMVIVTPLQHKRKKAPDEISVDEVLLNRLEDKAKLSDVKKHFKNAETLKKVKLKVDFYDAGATESFTSCLSETITDTHSKASGALSLHDATPLRSCHQGGRKVIMDSDYQWKAVEPRFQLVDNLGQRRSDLEDKLLIQPSEKYGLQVRPNTIHFITPPQPLMKQIEDQGLTIQLGVRRKEEKYESPFPLQFYYQNCGGKECPLCQIDIDGIGKIGPATIKPKAPKPKPGNKKRQMEEPMRDTSSKIVKIMKQIDNDPDTDMKNLNNDHLILETYEATMAVLTSPSQPPLQAITVPRSSNSYTPLHSTTLPGPNTSNVQEVDFNDTWNTQDMQDMFENIPTSPEEAPDIENIRPTISPTSLQPDSTTDSNLLPDSTTKISLVRDNTTDTISSTPSLDVYCLKRTLPDFLNDGTDRIQSDGFGSNQIKDDKKQSTSLKEERSPQMKHEGANERMTSQQDEDPKRNKSTSSLILNASRAYYCTLLKYFMILPIACLAYWMWPW